MTRLRGVAVVAVAAAVAAAVVPEEAPGGCQTHRCDVRVARKRCERGQFRGCVLRAALHRRQSYRDMLRVSWCESRWDRFAVNGVHLGPFQFRPETWASTPYGRFSRSSWKWSSLATAWMWQRGRRGEWTCQ